MIVGPISHQSYLVDPLLQELFGYNSLHYIDSDQALDARHSEYPRLVVSLYSVLLICTCSIFQMIVPKSFNELSQFLDYHRFAFLKIVLDIRRLQLKPRMSNVL